MGNEKYLLLIISGKHSREEFEGGEGVAALWPGSVPA